MGSSFLPPCLELGLRSGLQPPAVSQPCARGDYDHLVWGSYWLIGNHGVSHQEGEHGELKPVLTCPTWAFTLDAKDPSCGLPEECCCLHPASPPFTVCSLSSRKVYMDYNATTPLEPEVIEAVTEAMKEAWGNPSSSYVAGNLEESMTGKGTRGLLEKVYPSLAWCCL